MRDGNGAVSAGWREAPAILETRPHQPSMPHRASIIQRSLPSSAKATTDVRRRQFIAFIIG